MTQGAFDATHLPQCDEERCPHPVRAQALFGADAGRTALVRDSFTKTIARRFCSIYDSILYFKEAAMQQDPRLAYGAAHVTDRLSSSA